MLTTVCGGKTAAPATWTAENKTGGRMMMSVPFTSRPHVRYDGRGGVWRTQGDDYRIVRVRLGLSDTLAIVERKVAPTPVSAQERAEAIARADSAIKRFGSTNAAPFRLDEYRRPLIRGDTVYAVALDDDDVQQVVRARIRR